MGGDDLNTKSGGTGFDPAGSRSAVCPNSVAPAFVKVYATGSTTGLMLGNAALNPYTNDPNEFRYMGGNLADAGSLGQVLL